jgi:hypothetical protein
MKILLLILGVVAVAFGLFILDSRKKDRKTEAAKSKNHKDKSDRRNFRASELLDSPEAKQLKQSAATELGVSLEQLDRMSVEEIRQMATDRGLI